jgi:NTE family protein
MKHFSLILAIIVTCNISITGQSSKPRPKVGLVLSGGGAKGLAHIGVLKVLEEAGVPIDYIGGTSMGSIIGGLYAAGYSANQLDSISRSINWDNLLSDKISRQNLSMVEKNEDIKYLLSFPIRGNKITLPAGIVSGQNLNRLFTRLCAPVYHINDFSKLPIPFLCVAADIEKGEPIIIRNGNLVKAMRASMAIPTVFTPEVINGKPLLDGGILNNFPVKEVKEMGADIIIGVDVGFRYNQNNELNSLLKIMEQSIVMHSREQNLKSRDMCDILILPDISEYNASSFNHTDSLISKGIAAAKSVYSTIDSLSQYLQKFGNPVKPKIPIKIENKIFHITEVGIAGLNKIPDDFLLRKLPFEIPSYVSINTIDHFIEEMYGTWFFESITYNFETVGTGIKLVFTAIEKKTNYFKVGLHYDSDFKTTLLLNTTFRNKVYRGSKISLDLALGENPSLTASFYKYTGWRHKQSGVKRKLTPDYGLKLQARNLEVYGYADDKRIASFNFFDFTSDLFIQANLSNTRSIGLGATGDYTNISDIINLGVPINSSSYYLNIYCFSRKDSYNEAFYPNRGVKIEAEGKYILGISENVRSNPGFFQATMHGNFCIPFGKRISLQPGFSIGTSFDTNVPYQYLYYIGGLGGSSLRELIPFVGLNFMQRSNLHCSVGKLDFQFELWKDNFLIAKSNIGSTAFERKNLFAPENIVIGYGLSFGYRSAIGPMEITLMSSNRNPGLLGYINIGYWF